MKMEFNPIGTVRNAIKKRRDMGAGGVPSKITVFPRYAPALLGIGGCTHVWILCWLHEADRSVLRARPRKLSAALGLKGVFARRSPDRPNPVALSCARLLGVKHNVLRLGSLDAIDGTPVIDIKPYSPGIDCVPSAGSPDFAKKYKLAPDSFLAHMLSRIAENHCGKLNAEGLAACALALAYIRKTGRAPDAPASEIRTSLSGQGFDALHALFRLKPSAKITPVSKPGYFLAARPRGGGLIELTLSPAALRRFKKLTASGR